MNNKLNKQRGRIRTGAKMTTCPNALKRPGQDGGEGKQSGKDTAVPGKRAKGSAWIACSFLRTHYAHSQA